MKMNVYLNPSLNSGSALGHPSVSRDYMTVWICTIDGSSGSGTVLGVGGQADL